MCPSQEFWDSLVEKAEWVTEPFTGPRTRLLDVNRKGCRRCEAYGEEVIVLKLKINELEQKVQKWDPSLHTVSALAKLKKAAQAQSTLQQKTQGV